ncbi:MAG: tRNA (adenosine(37)-N6)-dimethylallyltransferase MiaA [Ruminococcus sp.]|nr:tRNA (adenosine(37)-N6)-dimethylallyltransferase MiaA [Ruminococcus sp.]
MMKQKVAAVIGPTASGKTALSVALANALGGEIVSADSMQIYKYMDIATAKPTQDEKQGIPHHLMDFLEPTESFSVARYCELASDAIKDIAARGRLPIIAGGTGLYVDALLGGMRFEEQEADPALRAQITKELEEKGIDAMLDEIRAFDPDSADRLSAGRNPKRIIRCIEVYRLTGMTQTQLNEKQRTNESPYDTVKIGLTAADREYLYERIDRRVDLMMESGLLEEARRFYDSGFSDTAAAAIGYKELLPYLRNEQELSVCVASLKRSTRRYAKRQLTWFRRDDTVHWFNIDELSFDTIVSESIRLLFVNCRDEHCSSAE